MSITIKIGRLTIVLLHITYERQQKINLPIGNLGQGLREYQSLVKGVNNATNKP